MSICQFAPFGGSAAGVKLPPGWWQRWTADGKATARVACPNCGAAASLADHDIRADGMILPSLICPAGCGFHGAGRLIGWQPVGLPQDQP